MNTLHILVVDDDRDFADGLADALELHGHRVERAFTGEEAIDRSREEDFDVIFMDVKLPGKDGFQCILDVRSCKPKVKVVIMTGYTAAHLMELARANGAWLTLRKPLNIRRVLEMLNVTGTCGSVLIADDDPDFAESLCESLEARRYRAFVARDGQEALDYLRTHDDVSALVLDLQMPGKTGLQVFRELKKEGRPLPTVIVTGHPVEEAGPLGAMCCLEVDGVLIKPFSPNDLVGVLADVVGSGKESPQ